MLKEKIWQEKGQTIKQTKKKTQICKISILRTKVINNKEQGLYEEFKNAKLNVLITTKTKKKGVVVKEMELQ